LKPGPNTQIGPKDFFEMASNKDAKNNAELDNDGFKIPKYDIGEFKDESEKHYSINGFINEKLAYGFFKNDPKLTMVRSIFHVTAKYEFENEWLFEGGGKAYYDLAYAIEGREKFEDKTLENNEYEIELRELFLNAKINSYFSIKAGRQIAAWGESNFAQITDIVNPRDITELGLVDLEDARIPVASIRLSYQKNPWIFDFISIHEFRGNKIGSYGSDYDYYKGFRESDIYIDDEDWNQSDFGNTEIVIKISKAFHGSDVSIVFGSFYDDTPYLDLNNPDHDVDQFDYILEPNKSRIKAIALSGNRAFGNTLLKSEIGTFFDMTFNRNDFITIESENDIDQNHNRTEKKDLVKGLLGFEYSGISETTITIEGLINYIKDYDNSIMKKEMTSVLYTDVTHEMLNDLMKLNLNWMYYYPGKGHIIRAKVAYKLTDNLKIEGGIIFYDASSHKNLIYSYKDQDRMFLSLKYHF
jgi:hypothetical protein